MTKSNRPTLNELGVLLGSMVDRTERKFLARAFGLQVDSDEPLPTAGVLKLAVIDWLHMANALADPPMIRSSAVMDVEKELDEFARRFDDLEATSDLRPGGAFGLLDFRYVFCVVNIGGDTVKSDFFDVKTGTRLPGRPFPVLTVLSCELGVLMSRLLVKMESIRQLEQHAPDSPTAAADASHSP